MMKIVNQTVPEALQRLGYEKACRWEASSRFIDENDTIDRRTQTLKPEHLPIL